MIESMEYNDSAESESYGDSSGEYNEASYGEAGYGEARRSPPVRTAPRQSAYTPRPPGTSAPVTQVQLQAALARVSQQIGTNSNAIKTVDGRVRGLATEQSRITAGLRKEVTDRKKDADALRRDLTSTRELSAVLPLITAGQTGPIAQLANLVFLLPPSLLSGSGSGDTSSNSGSLLQGNSVVAIAAIALASGVFNKA
jgi:hypothetical protein